MDINKFEQLAQGHIADHRSNIDGEAMWSAIEPILEEDKHKRRGLWWWFGFSTSAIALLLFIGITQQQDASLSETEKVINKPQINIHSSEKTFPNLEKNTGSNTHDLNISKNEGQHLNISKAPSNVDDKKVNRDNIISSQIRNLQKTRPSTDLVELNNLEIKTTKTDKTNVSEVLAQKPFPISHEAREILINKNASKEKNKSSIKTNTNKSAILKVVGSGIDNSVPPAYSEDVNQETANNNIAIKSDHLDSMKQAEQPVMRITAPRDSNAIIPFLNPNRKLKFGIALFSGVSKLNTTMAIVDANNPNSRLLLDSRNATEADLQTTSFGVQFSATTRKGLYAAVGLDYIQRTRKFEFDAAIVSYDSIPGVTHIFINPFTRNTFTEEGLVLETTTTSYRKKIYNKTSFINIPVTFGYLRHLDRWTLGAEVSTVFNIFSKHDGQILKNELEFYTLSRDQDDLYRNRVQAHCRIKVFGGYELADRVQISAGLRYQFRTVFSEQSNPISEDLKGFGVELGLHLSLSKSRKD